MASGSCSCGGSFRRWANRSWATVRLYAADHTAFSAASVRPGITQIRTAVEIAARDAVPAGNSGGVLVLVPMGTAGLNHVPGPRVERSLLARCPRTGHLR